VFQERFQNRSYIDVRGMKSSEKELFLLLFQERRFHLLANENPWSEISFYGFSLSLLHQWQSLLFLVKIERM
jgi:hypothetical protein